MSKYSPEYLTEMHREPMTLRFVKHAISNETILEAQVIACDEKNTLTVSIGDGIIGKIPFEELEYHVDGKDTKPVAATSKIGKHIKFIPESIEKLDNNDYLVNCSRKHSQKLCYDNYISKLVPGDIIDARVIKIVGYGIFCDIGCGYVALLPTNDISVTHIVNPETALKHVHKLKVVVKSTDDNKIQLSHKELLGTWEEEVSKFSIGDIVYGTVLTKESYGVFIRISQNLSGLADISEIDVEVGDTVAVKISSIKPENMKVKLILIHKIDECSGDESSERLSFKYTMTEGHISDWVYSTPEAKKQIESHF